MVTQTRNVTKSLAGMEDLQQLRGPHTQTRNGEAITVHGIDVPYAVGTVADMQALDVARFQYARVYSSAASYTDYFYDAESTLGESSDTGIGSWLARVVDQPTQTLTIAELRTFEPVLAYQETNLLGHTLPGIGGDIFWHDASDTTTPDNNGTVIRTTAGDKCWKRKEKGFLSPEDLGSPRVDGEDITAILNVIKSLTNKIVINHKFITLSSDVQLYGVSVCGSDTTVSGFELVGGLLTGITSDEQYERLMPDSNQSPSVSRHNTKMVVRQNTIPSGAPIDAYSVISPSSHGGIARFILATGVGGSGSGDLGGTWDRLRVVGAMLYSDGYAINNSVSAQSGAVLPATHQLENFLDTVTDKYTPDGTDTILDVQLDQNEWVEYTVNGNVNQSGNVAFYTSGGSSDDVTILVNGIEVAGYPKQISGAAANTVRLVSVSYDKDTDNVVRITNNHATAKAYVYGVNLYRAANLSKMDSVESGYITNMILTGERNVLYSGNGASLDHVIRDNNSKLGGSYHGGETAMSEFTVTLRIQASADYKKLKVGTSLNTDPAAMGFDEVLCGDNILALSLTSITVNEGTLNVRTSLDFGVDGGCNVTGSMNATTQLTLTRLYSGMHATDRSLNKYLTGSLIEGSPTENNVSIKRSMLPFYQFNNDTQCCISPQTFELGMSKKQSRIWDNANYIKFYYQPLDNVDYVLQGGEDLRFSCLYQYGDNLI